MFSTPSQERCNSKTLKIEFVQKLRVHPVVGLELGGLIGMKLKNSELPLGK
jgi:hypothetical protein